MTDYEKSTAATTGAGQRQSHRRPSGYRWVSVLLPQETFNHLHIQAMRSNMSFRQYMQKFCSEAWPYNDTGETATSTS